MSTNDNRIGRGIRRYFPAIALGAVLVGATGGYAAARGFGGDSCCKPGAACCTPGADCCKGAHGEHAHDKS